METKGLKELVDTIQSYNPGGDVDVLRRAHEFAASIHGGQARRSGDPYLSHPMEVAAILTELRMDERAIAAGLLHDAIEDTQTTIGEIRTLFGDEIADLVDGVTKLSKLPFSTREDRQAESFRKMVLAMAKDIRVIVIKLADRLHNMRTLDPLPEAKRCLIAKETLEIYAPLAHRLGMAKIKQELEDLSLRHLDPEAYRDLAVQIAKKREEREAQINEVITILKRKLTEVDIPCEITGRPKHFYSIHRKMREQEKTLDEIYDLTAVRVIASTLKDCYGALGIIHSLWKPIPGRFKDFIAVPKSNMYQSLHTTVIGPKGEPAEIQIRTEEMHRTAEEGIAVHWAYKEGKATLDETEKNFLWLRQMLDWGKDLKDSREFLDAVRIDLFPEEVYVFTPKGDVKALPRGATPIDFAFTIHTDIGLHCAGARINGRIVPLRYELRNGDIVEILRSETQHPSRDWLRFVKTSRARGRIRGWIKNQEWVRSIVLGKELLDREIRKLGKKSSALVRLETLPQVLEHYRVGSEEALHAAIGYGKISPRQAVLKLLPAEQAQAIAEEESRQRKPRPKAAVEGIKIEGVDDILVHFAKCCHPLPGDEVIGFITRGRGVSIHIADCPNMGAFRYDPERQTRVYWDERVKISHQVKIRVIVAEDRPGLLAEISAAISSANANITQAEIKVTEEKRGLNTFVLEVLDLKQLQEAMQAIRRVRGVMRVERIRSH